MPAMLLNAEAAKSAPVFAALGDVTRLRLVARLSEGEPLSITELSARGRMTRQAITKHLHVLQEAGLVEGRRKGREQLWELRPGQFDEAREYLEAIGRRWDEALARLKAHVEKDE